MKYQSPLTWGDLSRIACDTIEKNPATVQRFRHSFAEIAAFADAFKAICQNITPDQNRSAMLAYQASMRRQGF